MGTRGCRACCCCCCCTVVSTILIVVVVFAWGALLMSPRAARRAPPRRPPMTLPTSGRAGTAVAPFSFALAVAVAVFWPNVLPWMPGCCGCTPAFSSVLTRMAGRPRPPPCARTQSASSLVNPLLGFVYRVDGGHDDSCQRVPERGERKHPGNSQQTTARFSHCLSQHKTIPSCSCSRSCSFFPLLCPSLAGSAVRAEMTPLRWNLAVRCVIICHCCRFDLFVLS
jgi:hypothetical protein